MNGEEKAKGECVDSKNSTSDETTVDDRHRPNIGRAGGAGDGAEIRKPALLGLAGVAHAVSTARLSVTHTTSMDSLGLSIAAVAFGGDGV